MSVVTVQPPVAIFREEQWFPWWVYALLMGVVATGLAYLFWDRPGGRPPLEDPQRWGIELPLALVVGLTVPPVLMLGVLKMTTEVLPGELRLWFGLVPTFRCVLAIDSIKSVQVSSYRPIRDCGGWGIRRTRSGIRVFTARGNRCVELVLDDGTKVWIGTQRPDELAAVLDSAIRTIV